MQEHLPEQPLPYSLLASMYLSWEQHRIPAVYYHYLLSIMPKKDKKTQLLLMTKQIKSLKSNTHPYHNIVNAIEARERSLQVVYQNLDVLKDYQSTAHMETKANTSDNPNNADLDFSGCYPTSPNSPYRVQHEDPRSPLLSPALNSPLKARTAKLNQLINHLRLYQRLTSQIIITIFEWQQQLVNEGYKQSVISFQYHKEDYLSKLLSDTSQILDQYQHIFQNNCFLIVKKIHEKSEYALFYRELRIGGEFVQKVYQCLNILAEHEADVVRFRMLAKVGQTANRKKSIVKSTSLMKKYMNLNNGHDYIVVKDTETMKKSKVVIEPTLSRNKRQTEQQNQKIKKLKNSIIVNPEARILTIDRTQRKHPVQSPIFNLLRQTKRFPSNGRPQIKPSIPQVYFKALQSQQDIPSPRKYSENTNYGLNRSQTDETSILRRNNSVTISKSLGLINEKFKETLSQANFRQPVSVKPVHIQNQIVVGQRYNNNRDDQIQRNKGLSMQRKLQAFDKVNTELKLKNRSHAELKANQKKIKDNQPAFKQNKQIKPIEKQQKQEQKQIESTIAGQLPQQSPLKLCFQQNIKSSQIINYLRDKVFKTSPQIQFQQIQAVAKKILLQKNSITLIKIESQELPVAWMAVKFLQKDNINMGKSVFIVYVRRFVRVTHFQSKLADIFVKSGYGLIRNEQKILYEVDVIDKFTRPVIKIKYKVSPDISQPKSPLKSLSKTHPNLPQCRLLKYYTYSKQTKYHKYCTHVSSSCSISYNFMHVSKLYIDKNPYLQLKVDSISKMKRDVYRINCVVNQTELLIGKSLQSIVQMERIYQSIERDSSFEDEQEINLKYIAVRESKVMNKYVSSGKDDTALLCEFVSISPGAIPQVKSITFNKQQLKDKVLIFDPPYCIAIAVRAQGQLKTLAVVSIE